MDQRPRIILRSGETRQLKILKTGVIIYGENRAVSGDLYIDDDETLVISGFGRIIDGNYPEFETEKEEARQTSRLIGETMRNYRVGNPTEQRLPWEDNDGNLICPEKTLRLWSEDEI